MIFYIIISAKVNYVKMHYCLWQFENTFKIRHWTSQNPALW